MGVIEQGFNSDIIFAGTKYHVQTEDWGEENPFVVTRVFHSGKVVVSLKTTYHDLRNQNSATGRQAIRLGMRQQHEKVLDQLVSGTLLNASLR